MEETTMATKKVQGTIVPGTAKNDTLAGGVGNDTFYGYGGRDTFIYRDGEGKDVIADYAAEDLLSVKGAIKKAASTKNDVVFTVGKGSVTLKNAASKTITLNNGSGAYTMNKTALHATANFSGTLDAAKYLTTITTVNGGNTTKGVTFYGNAKANTLTGGSGNDKLYGLAGNDTLKGGAGKDMLDGGAGNDYLYGGAGNDSLSGAAGNDYLDGGAGSNILTGGAGNDTLKGGADSNNLTGGAGNDLFVYGGGADTITDYGLGKDTLSIASTTIDSLTVSGNDVVLTLVDKGKITVKNAAKKTVSYIDKNTKKGQMKIIKDGTENAGDAKANLLEGKDNKNDRIFGYGGNDTIRGLGSADYLNGGAGNDYLEGGAGNDSLYGEAGNDTFVYRDGDGTDVIYDFGKGTDTLHIAKGTITGPSISGADVIYKVGKGSVTLKNAASKTITVKDAGGNISTMTKTDLTAKAGFKGTLDASKISTIKTVNGSKANAVTMYGSAIANTITGGNGNDKLYGNGGNDKLVGGKGNDYLYGGTGNDTLTGGAGSDTFAYKGGEGVDVVSDYEVGKDTLQILGGDLKSTTVAKNKKDIVLQFSSGSVTLQKAMTKNTYLTLQNAEGGVYTMHKDWLTAAQGFIGTMDAAGLLTTITTLDASRAVKATALYGNANNNTLVSGTGNDYLYGGAGADKLAGGSGNDTLIGGTDNDTLTGGAGNDLLLGGAGNDSMAGGGGNDTFVYRNGEGADVVADYTAGQDSLQIANGAISKVETRSGNMTFTVGNGTVTLQKAADKTITVKDSQGGYTLTSKALTLGTDFTGTTLDATKYLSTITKVDGRSAAKTVNLIGNKNANEIRAGKAGGTLRGGAGNDTLYGGNGKDVFQYDSGSDVVYGYEAGKDTIRFASTTIKNAKVSGNDLVLSLANNGAITVKNAATKTISYIDSSGKTKTFLLDQQIFGNSNNNTLVGGIGNDTLRGYAGNDTLTGGSGKDIFWYDSGNDVILDYEPGKDTVRFSGTTLKSAKASGNNTVLTLANNGTITVKGMATKNISYIDSSGKTKTLQAINRIVNGTGNSETLSGGEGNDTISGLAGNDTLKGGKGNDSLLGGDGNDVFVFAKGDGNDVIADYNQKGSDRLEISGAAVTKATTDAKNNVILTIGSNEGTVTLTGAKGKTINLKDSRGSYTLSDNAITLDKTFAGKTLDLRQFASVIIIDAYQAKQNIALIGNTQANLIYSGMGDDTMTGGEGSDTFAYFDGNGKDTVMDYTGGDVLFIGDDQLANVALTNGNNDITFTVGDGTVTLQKAASKTVTLWVDNYESTGVYTMSKNSVVLQSDFTGLIDSRCYLDSVTSIDGHLVTTDTDIFGNGISNTIRAGKAGGLLHGFTGNDTLYGGVGNDSLFGDNDDDWLYGDAGNDSLDGGAGNDYLEGGAESDTLTGGAGNDTFVFAGSIGKDFITDYNVSGTDTILINYSMISKTALTNGGKDMTFTVGSGTITLQDAAAKTVTMSVANLLGSGHYKLAQKSVVLQSDYIGAIDSSSYLSTLTTLDGRLATRTLELYGNSNANIIYAGKAGGTLRGYAGNDTLYGGAGNDTFQYDSGNDVIYNYAEGKDTIRFASTTLQYCTADAKDMVMMLANGGTIRVKDGTGKSISYLDSSGKMNTSVLVADVLNGTNNADLLNGCAGNDTIYGFAGNDTLNGLGGNDSLYGGNGDDSLLGGAGNDTLCGGAGADKLVGGDDNDWLYGENGNDFLNGGEGDDKLDGGTGNDILYGGTGNDTFVLDANTLQNVTIGDYAENQDWVQVIGTTNLHAKVQGEDVVLTVGNGSATLKNAAKKRIYFKDASGNSLGWNQFSSDTQQSVIKNFMKILDETTLTDDKALNEAVAFASNRLYTKWDDLVEGFKSIINNYGGKEGDTSTVSVWNGTSDTVRCVNTVKNQWTNVTQSMYNFLKGYCGIDLANKDTGALTGLDADGVLKTAENIVDENGGFGSGVDWYSDCTPSKLYNGIQVHWPDMFHFAADVDADSAQAIAGALNEKWLVAALNLVKESYGIGFDESDVRIKPLNIHFVYDSEENGVAWVNGAWDMTINMYYWNGINVWQGEGSGKVDKDKNPNGASHYLDRTIVHELTHAVINANLNNGLANLLSNNYGYIHEGLAELVHGIDDKRFHDICTLAMKNNASVLTSAFEGKASSYSYAGGYMLFRYLAKYVADCNAGGGVKWSWSNSSVASSAQLFTDTSAMIVGSESAQLASLVNMTNTDSLSSLAGVGTGFVSDATSGSLIASNGAANPLTNRKQIA